MIHQDVLISQDMNFTPDNSESLPHVLIEFVNFRRAEIFVLLIRCFPFSRIKLENMDFGIKIIQNAESISNATVLEELNMISSEISY